MTTVQPPGWGLPVQLPIIPYGISGSIALDSPAEHAIYISRWSGQKSSLVVGRFVQDKRGPADMPSITIFLYNLSSPDHITQIDGFTNLYLLRPMSSHDCLVLFEEVVSEMNDDGEYTADGFRRLERFFNRNTLGPGNSFSRIPFGPYGFPLGRYHFDIVGHSSHNDITSDRLNEFFSRVEFRLLAFPPTISYDEEQQLLNTAINKARPDTTCWPDSFQGNSRWPTQLRALTRSASRNRVYDVIKRVGGAYLGYLYGVRPIPQDLRNLGEALQIIKHSRTFYEASFRSSREFYDGGWRGRRSIRIDTRGREETPLFTDVNTFLDEIEHLSPRALYGTPLRILTNEELNYLHDMGIPTTIADLVADVWEYLPFSFVVDWFLGINMNLRRIGRNRWVERLPIDFYCKTIYGSRDDSDFVTNLCSDLGFGDFVANVHTSYYSREYSKSVPELGFRVLDPTDAFPNHWLEMMALSTIFLK